jgi:hypothetical protein
LGLTHGSIGSGRGGELLKICLRGRNMSVSAYEVAAFAAMIVVFEHTASSISTNGNGDLICHDASCICVTLSVDTVMWRLSTARPLTCVIFVQDRFDGTCFARDVLYCSSRWSARQFLLGPCLYLDLLSSDCCVMWWHIPRSISSTGTRVRSMWRCGTSVPTVSPGFV